MIATTTTNASGAYQFSALRAGSYGVRFVSNGAVKGKAKSNSGALSGEYIRNLSVTTGSSISDADAIVIDPAGVIYNSTTRLPVAGAVVRFLYNGTLVNNSWLDQTLGGANTQTTAADGRYSFVLNGTAQTGTYSLDVTAPTGYTFQSTAIAPTAGPYDPGLGGGVVAVQSQSTAPTGGDSTTYYLDFNLTVGGTAATTSNGVINNHIPIDPVRTVSIANTTNAAEPGTNGSMTVTLNAPTFTNTNSLDGSNAPAYTFSYAENSTTSTTLGTVTASDAESDPLTFSITGGNSDGWYAIDANTGVITLTTAGVASIANDFEQTTNTRAITVTVSDGALSQAIQVTLNETNVNDGTPVFTGTNSTGTGNAPAYSFNYAENSATGSTLGTLTASDSDGNTLTFSLTGGNSSGWYAIDPSTGVIKADARLGAKGVPTFTTEMHRLVIEPNQAVHASPISLADNLQAGVRLAAVDVGDETEFGH